MINGIKQGVKFPGGIVSSEEVQKTFSFSRLRNGFLLKIPDRLRIGSKDRLGPALSEKINEISYYTQRIISLSSFTEK